MTVRLHPDFDSLCRKLSVYEIESHALNTYLFRMVDPRQFRDADILNGVGGYRCSGRWNLKKQFHCTYMSKTPETALEEILAPSRRKNLPDANRLPRVLVCIAVDLHNLLDLTDGQLRQKLRISEKRMIELQWYKENYNQREAITQAIGRAAFTEQFEGLVIPSAAVKDGTNVIVFPENLKSTSNVRVITPIEWK